MIEELAQSFPSIMAPLIFERDMFMGACLMWSPIRVTLQSAFRINRRCEALSRLASSKQHTVLAVMGMGHVQVHRHMSRTIASSRRRIRASPSGSKNRPVAAICVVPKVTSPRTYLIGGVVVAAAGVAGIVLLVRYAVKSL